MNVLARRRIKLILIATAVAIVVGGFIMSGLQRLHGNLLSDRVDTLERRVGEAYLQVNNYYQLTLNGDMGEKAARRAALEAVRQLGAGEDDYFWIVDLQGELLMHTTRPNLEGQRLQAMEQFEGSQFFAAIETVVNQAGYGFIEYRWPRSDSDHLLDKVGYVKRFVPWQLVIGSSVYTDDVSDIYRQEVTNLLAVMAILFAVLIVFWFGFERALFFDMDGARLSQRRDGR